MFSGKFTLQPAVLNEYTDLAPCCGRKMSGFLPIRKRVVMKSLSSLRDDSGTGPDKLPARILKKCAAVLAVAVALLARIILRDGVWPNLWKHHWLFPLFKRKSRAEPSNYRGIHLTSQLSKVVERVLGRFWQPYLLVNGSLGRH